MESAKKSLAAAFKHCSITGNGPEFIKKPLFDIVKDRYFETIEKAKVDPQVPTVHLDLLNNMHSCLKAIEYNTEIPVPKTF